MDRFNAQARSYKNGVKEQGFIEFWHGCYVGPLFVMTN